MFRDIFAATLLLTLATSANAQTGNEKIEEFKSNKKAYSEYQKVESALGKLNPMQYNVTQHAGTEPAFQNEYWDFWEDGIYVDVVTGEPLFSSTDKYDAGNGWPSFHKPINDNFVSTRADKTLGLTRIEVRSKSGDSHLGHVFDDGVKEKGGQHFCINSAALRFVPKLEMQKQGYGEYMSLFNK